MYEKTVTRLLEFMEKSGKTQVQIVRETGLFRSCNFAVYQRYI